MIWSETKFVKLGELKAGNGERFYPNINEIVIVKKEDKEIEKIKGNLRNIGKIGYGL